MVFTFTFNAKMKTIHKPMKIQEKEAFVSVVRRGVE